MTTASPASPGGTRDSQSEYDQKFRVVDDHLDALVVARKALQYLNGAIGGGVVDEYQLECVFGEIGGECLADSFIELGDVVLFIEGAR